MISDIETRHALKLLLIVAAIVLLWFWRRYRTRGLPGGGRLFFDTALVATALLSVFAYFEFGWLRYDQYMNPHDVYHYYMGAKYSPEHRYFDLYRATLVADDELGRHYTESTIRNLNDHRFESSAMVLARAENYRAAFSPARWEEFKADVAYWRGVMPAYKWNRLLKDKGYNATPVWNGIARFLAEHAHTQNPWAMRALTYLDPVLLLLGFAALWAAFGWRAMLFAVIFHCTNYFMAFVHIKGAFLRLDWLVALVAGTALLYRNHYKSAGALIAFAASARVFPGLFVFGLGVKFAENLARVLWARLRKRPASVPLNWNYVQFFAAFGIVLGVLCLGSLLTDSGPALWKNFAAKIAVHNSDISTTRVGFKYIFLGGETNKAVAFETMQDTWRLLLVAALMLTALLARRLRDWETVPFSFAPVFFLSAPTFYYFVMLLVPLLLFLPEIERRRRMLGAMALFALSAFGYLLNYKFDHHFQLFYLLSCGILAFIVYTGFIALFSRPDRQAGPLGGIMMGRFAFAKSVFLTSLAGGLLLAGTAGAAWYLAQADTPSAPAAATPPRDAVPEKSAAATPTTGTAELVLVGDVMLSRNVARSIAENGRNFRFPFLAAAAYTQAADIAFCNLECPISGRGEKLADKNYVFNAPPEAAEGLAFAGFDLVSLANNHTLDYGPVALTDTEQLMQDKGIRTLGVTVEDSPQSPVLIEVQGLRVGFLAYCDPVPTYSYAREFYAFDRRPAKGDRETLARDIAALRPAVDILVVSMHWGIEYAQPNEHQIALGRFIVDQGADIVAGHHPHVQQDAEVYKGKLIIHSMGNFVFDQWTKDGVRDSRLYRVAVTKDGIARAEYIPMTIPKGVWQPTKTGDPVLLMGAVAEAG